jgi:hypothetical protein
VAVGRRAKHNLLARVSRDAGVPGSDGDELDRRVDLRRPFAVAARPDHDPTMSAETISSAELRPRPDASGQIPPEPDSLALAKRELRRARTRALALLVATYLIAVGALLVLTLMGTPAEWWGAALFLAFVAMAPLLAASTWLMMRRRFWPGIQTLRWANGSANAAWIVLDGGGPPADADEALARLVGRADDDAVAMRAAWLASADRTAELRSVLDGWSPADPVNVARHARAASVLSLLEGVVDDLGPAWEAASAIQDPSLRVEQQARVFIEDSRRRAAGGEDPFPPLVEARHLLGPRAAEFDTDEDRRGIRHARLVVAAWGLVPAIVFALIGLAAWSGMLG